MHNVGPRRVGVRDPQEQDRRTVLPKTFRAHGTCLRPQLVSSRKVLREQQLQERSLAIRQRPRKRAPTYRYACRLGLDRALSLVDHSDTLADHLRNAARAAQMRSRQGRVECLRDSDGLFALTRSQYFPGLAKRRSSAGFLRQRARLERLNPCAASTFVRAARIQEEL